MPKSTQIDVTALYIHIPFCKSICPYCAFYKIPWNPAKEAPFITALLKEIDSYKNPPTTQRTLGLLRNAPDVRFIGERGLPRRREQSEAGVVELSENRADGVLRNSPTLSSIFIGGGTPSALTPHYMDTLLSHLKTVFIIPDDIEKTCEMNPESITQDTLDVLIKHKFNRISMGVQSFNQSELTYLGRTHSNDTVFKAIDLIKKNNFTNWNLDLIFASEPSSVSSFKATLDLAIAQNPPHISAYSLSIEKGTSFEKKQIPWPKDDEDYSQYNLVISTLTQAGYRHYEISNFAKEGHECQHNLAYWKLENYIGIGPSAVSYCNGYHYQNPADLEAYMADPIPKIPPHPEPLLSQINDALSALLRLKDGLDLAQFNHRFGVTLHTDKASELAPLIQNQLVSLSKTHLCATPKGQLVLDLVIEKLLYSPKDLT